jgi:hypothetical protein
MEQGPRSRLVACWFHATTVGQCKNMVVYWEKARFVGRVLLFVVLHKAEGAQGAVSLVSRVCGQVGQVVAGVSLEVSEVMRDPVGRGEYYGAKNVGLVLGPGLVQFGRGRRPM